MIQSKNIFHTPSLEKLDQVCPGSVKQFWRSGSSRTAGLDTEQEQIAIHPLKGASFLFCFGDMAEEDVFVHWRCYCRGVRRSVYLDGQGPWADKEEILRFLAHKAFITYCDYPAICDMLDAIRDEHLRMGLPNPLTDKPLVKIAMEDAV